MTNFLMITGHALGDKRKASFLFMVDAIARRDHQAQVVTVDYSRLGSLKWGRPPHHGPGEIYQVAPHLRGYIWFPLFHPLHPRGRLFNALTGWMAAAYPLLMGRRFEQMARSADVIIIESGFGLALFARLKKLNPRAKFICMMSDLMETLGFHPAVLARAHAALPRFDFIFYPAQAMAASLPQDSGKCLFVPQGIDKSVFKTDAPSPFSTPRQAISVGDMLFDAAAIETLALRFPDWTFHLFGKLARIGKELPNVVTHGEMAFARLAPYFLHADIGIAPYALAANAGYLSQSSLKMVQYTYCRLPIVAPDFAASGRPHVCAYTPGDAESLARAFAKATAYDRSTIDADATMDWDDIAAHILQKIGA